MFKTLIIFSEGKAQNENGDIVRHLTLASCKTDFHCKIKEALFSQELKSSLNVNVSSEKLLLY